MGLRPEQFNIKELLRYFVARHEFKRANLIDQLKDLTPEEKFTLNINDNISGDEYNSNYYNHIYNIIKNDIINGNDGLIINDEKLSGEAYYFKSFLLTYPLKYILKLRNIKYSQWDESDDLWERILESNPEIEYADKIIDADTELERVSDLKVTFYYSDKNAIIKVFLKDILNNRGIFYSDSIKNNLSALLNLIINTNPPLSEKIYDNDYLEPKCFYTESYLEKYAFWKVLSNRNIDYKEEFSLEKLYELIQDSQTQYDKFESCNDENLIAESVYEYEFLRKYGLVILLRNRGYDVNFDDLYEDLLDKIEKSNPSINDDFSLTLKSLQRDQLRLRSRLDNFEDGILYKLGENFFVRKGQANYLGNNYKLKIRHDSGIVPVAVVINNIENEFGNDSIGDVYVNFDSKNIYVYNTGSARSRFEWNIIFSNNYLPVEKLSNNIISDNNSYLIKIKNFDELELQYNHNYDLSEYHEFLKDDKQFFIINGMIYSFNDVRIQFLEDDILYFSKDLVKNTDNEVYVTNIPNIESLFDSGNIELDEEDNILTINLFNFISKFKLGETDSIVRKITNLENRLHTKIESETGRTYYEIDLSEFGNVDNELVIINGVTYTMYSGSVVFDDDTEVLRIFDFEILPIDEIYITAISEASYLDELSNLDFDKYIYTNSFSSFGQENYSGENGEVGTVIYHGLNRIPSLVNITSVETDGSKIGNIWYTYDENKITVYNVGEAKTKFRWIAILDNNSYTIDSQFDSEKDKYDEVNNNFVIYHASLSSYPDEESDLYSKKDNNSNYMITSSKNTMSNFRINLLYSNIIYKHKRYLEYADGYNTNEDGKFDNDKNTLPNGTSQLNYSGSFRSKRIEAIGKIGYTQEFPSINITEEFHDGNLISYDAEKDTFKKSSFDGNLVIGTYHKNAAFNAKSDVKYTIPVNTNKFNYVSVRGIIKKNDMLIVNPLEDGTAISMSFIEAMNNISSLILEANKNEKTAENLNEICIFFIQMMNFANNNDTDSFMKLLSNGSESLLLKSTFDVSNDYDTAIQNLENMSEIINRILVVFDEIIGNKIEKMVNDNNVTDINTISTINLPKIAYSLVKTSIIGNALTEIHLNNDTMYKYLNRINLSDEIDIEKIESVNKLNDSEPVVTAVSSDSSVMTFNDINKLISLVLESYNTISYVPVVFNNNPLYIPEIRQHKILK